MKMINSELIGNRYALNSFTSELLSRINKSESKTYAVRLRNGKWLEIVYHIQKEVGGTDLFRDPEWNYVWDMNGGSVTSEQYDIVEIPDCAPPDRDIQIQITQEQRGIIMAALFGFHSRAVIEFDRERYSELFKQFEYPDNSKKDGNVYLFNKGLK
jgi:hypothetical protein